eukprot:gene50602-67759_t
MKYDDCLDTMRDMKRSTEEAVRILNNMLKFDMVQTQSIPLERDVVPPLLFIKEAISTMATH